jgi:hypothetical protein
MSNDTSYITDFAVKIKDGQIENLLPANEMPDDATKYPFGDVKNKTLETIGNGDGDGAGAGAGDGDGAENEAEDAEKAAAKNKTLETIGNGDGDGAGAGAGDGDGAENEAEDAEKAAAKKAEMATKIDDVNKVSQTAHALKNAKDELEKLEKEKIKLALNDVNRPQIEDQIKGLKEEIKRLDPKQQGGKRRSRRRRSKASKKKRSKKKKGSRKRKGSRRK